MQAIRNSTLQGTRLPIFSMQGILNSKHEALGKASSFILSGHSMVSTLLALLRRSVLIAHTTETDHEFQESDRIQCTTQFVALIH